MGQNLLQHPDIKFTDTLGRQLTADQVFKGKKVAVIGVVGSSPVDTHYHV